MKVVLTPLEQKQKIKKFETQSTQRKWVGFKSEKKGKNN